MSSEAIQSNFTTSNPSHSYTFRWSIENFLGVEAGMVLTSPKFTPILDKTCYASLEKTKPPEVVLSFHHPFFSNNVTVKVCLSLHNYKGDKIVTPSTISYQRDESKISFLSYFHIKYPNASRQFNFNDFPTGLILVECKLYFSNYEIRTKNLKKEPQVFSAENFQSLNDDLLKIYESTMGADVTFKIKNTTVLAHKAILMARSEVFSRMFQNNMKETQSNEIEINDVDPDAFKALLKYFYTDKLDDKINYNIAKDLYCIAEKYNSFNLKRNIALFLISVINSENAVELLGLAYLHCDNDLMENSKKFIKEHKLNLAILDAVREILGNKEADSKFVDIIKSCY